MNFHSPQISGRPLLYRNRLDDSLSTERFRQRELFLVLEKVSSFVGVGIFVAAVCAVGYLTNFFR